MKSKVMAALASVLMAVGLVLFGGAGVASANGPWPPTDQNRVQNSPFSNSNISVAHNSNYVDLIPGYTAWSSPWWHPDFVSMQRGQAIAWRIIGPDGWASQWTYKPRSNVYQFIDTGGIFDFFGCQPITWPCEIQMIADNPQ